LPAPVSYYLDLFDKYNMEERYKNNVKVLMSMLYNVKLIYYWRVKKEG
jgi:hypothetical protein